jgi:agmatinase
MDNVLKLKDGPGKLVQVGIRDFCREEWQAVESDPQRLVCFLDRKLKSSVFRGASWQSMCDKILRELPEQVYLSFDIDGLNPSLCPGTGTPVPGGLSFDEAIHLVVAVARSGREIIGFDLCEVAPRLTPSGDIADEWDGNVGARVLYKLCGALLYSQGHLQGLAP